VELKEYLPPKDLTGDGLADIVGNGFTNNISDKIIIIPADGQGGFSSSFVQISLPTSVFSFSPLFIVDFNNDGKNDILVWLDSNPSSVLIYRNDGGNNFTPLTVSPISNNEVIQNVVDINNDNIADLLTYTGNAQNNTDFYRFGNANGTFGPAIQLAAGEYNIAADFNNDGKVDFPVLDKTTSNFILYESNKT
jgi:hypothetical protein